MTAPGATQLGQLQAAGFTPEEIDTWLSERTSRLSEAGFSQDEIQTWLGRPPVNDAPLRQHFKTALTEATATEGEGSEPKELTLDQAFQAGWQNSVTGLAARQKGPDVALSENPRMAERIAAQVGTLAGDLPAMAAGFLIAAPAGGGAGSTITGMGGAFALPAALRKVLVEKYENGEIQSAGRFWEVASGAFLEEFKGFVTGAATGATGVAAGAAGAPAAVRFASEIGTMVTVGSALEGRLPEPEEFVDAAIVLGGVKGAMRGAGKLRSLYAERGVRPAEVARDAASEKTIAEDLASENIETPRVYRDRAAEETRLDAELVRARQQASEVAPEALEGIETLDGAQGRVFSRLSVGEDAPRTKGGFNRFYQDWIDKLSPLKTAVDAMAEGKELPAVEDAYKMARMQVSASSKADHFLRYGSFDLEGNPTGSSLRAVLRPAAEKLDSLRVYLAARRTLELSERGIETGIDVADARSAVSELRGEMEPIARELGKYQTEVLEYFRKSGMLSDEQVAGMLEANRSYVPFYRVLEGERSGGAGPGKAPDVFQMIQKIEGSDLRVVDPLESIVKNTYALIEMAERNRVHRTFVELAEKSEVGSEYATRAKEGGLPGKNQIRVYRDGKPEIWDVQPEVYEAFAAGDAQSAGLLMRWLSKPASLLRAGSVLSPEFMARNPIRDQVSAFLFSGQGFKPVLDMARGLFEMVNINESYQVSRGELYKEWLRSGGPMAAMQSLDRTYLQNNVRGLMQETGLLEVTRNALRHPVEALRVLAEIGENATRVGEFAKVRKAGGSLEEAGFASREITLDFNRSGRIGQEVNRIVAFFNANIQGSDKMARAFKEHPARMTARVIGSITLPSIALYLYNRDKPGFDEIPQWQKDLFWPVYVGDGKTAEWRKIPKPFDVGIIFGTGAERVAEWILEKDPKAFDEFGEALARGATPGIVPTAAIPVIEAWANRSIFLDRPLVPASREKMLPEYQYQPYTTELTKAVAHALAELPLLKRSRIVSPAVIDNTVRGWTGGLGVHLVNLANRALTEAGQLPQRTDPTDTLADIPFVKAFAIRFPTAGAESIQKFYERYAQEEDLLHTIRQLAKEGEPEAALREFQIAGGATVDLHSIRDTLSGMSTLTRAIYRNPELSKDEKRQLIDETYERMIDVAKAGNLMLDRVEAVRRSAQ